MLLPPSSSTTRTPLIPKSETIKSVDLHIQNARKARLSVDVIQVLGDNSCPYIKQRNIYDIVASWTARRPSIPPENRWLLAWHALIMAIILYYFFEVGLLWGYGQAAWEDELNYFYIANFIFLTVLIIDCFVSTLKAFYSHGQLVTHPRLIVKRYLKWRVWIDVIAILSVAVPVVTQVFALNWIKGLFLLKIVTLYEIDVEFIRVTQLSISIHTFYLLCRLVLFLILGSHYIGIWFYMIDYWVYENNYYGPNTPNLCWIYNAQAYSQMVLLLPWYGQYEYTMYFSIGTMTTIAYGDITPLNPLQTIYITFALFAYTIGFGYILSEILRILMEAQASKFEHTNNLLLVSNMMQDNLITQRIQFTVKSHFEKVWKEEIYRNREIEVSLIQQLPQKIRNELYEQLYAGFYTHIHLPTEVKTDFMVAISNSVKEVRLVEGYNLYSNGEAYDPDVLDNHSCYYIKQVLKRKLTPSIELSVLNYTIDILVSGCAGLESFYTGEARDHHAKVLDSVLVYSLSRKVILENIYLATQEQQQILFYLSESILSILPCWICKQEGHRFNKCRYTTFQCDVTRLIERDRDIQTALAGPSGRRQKEKKNSLVLWKQMSQQKYKVRNKYEMAVNNPFYSSLLLGSKRSQHLQHTQHRRQTQDKIQELNIKQIESQVEEDEDESDVEKEQVKMMDMSESRPSPLRRGRSEYLEDDLLASGADEQDGSEEQPEKTQSKRDCCSSCPSSSSQSSEQNSSIELENYVRETEQFIQHLQDANSRQSALSKQTQEDMGRDLIAYYPDHNVSVMISKYNESLKDMKRHRHIQPILFRNR